MIFVIGKKVNIIERRYFPKDLCHHFVGEVIRYKENTIWPSSFTHFTYVT